MPDAFDCIECGIHVVAFPRAGGPRCATCQWLAEQVDPAKRQKLRARLIELGVIEDTKPREGGAHADAEHRR